MSTHNPTTHWEQLLVCLFETFVCSQKYSLTYV